jgi:hypothetical protein
MSTEDRPTNNKEKDKEDKEKKDRPLDGDPPIIVGGGGSTYIWVRRNFAGAGTLQPFPNPDPQYPIPPADLQYLIDNYYCYDIGVDLGSYRTHDGEDEGNPHRIKQRRRHWTRFFRQ